LIESKNIKKCSAIFHKTHSYTEIETIGQSVGTDGHSGSDTSDMTASWGGPGYIKSKLIVPSESTVWGRGELVDRAKWEAIWQSSDQVRIFITVSGWYRTANRLWWPFDEVNVFSPLIPMESMMTIQAVTFKQDMQNGTETEIELRFPWGLNSTTPVGKITGPGGTPPAAIPPGDEIPPTP
jgi:prophage tail gpP-like protein